MEVGGIGISCVENGGEGDDDFVCYVYICFSIFFSDFFFFASCTLLMSL